MNSIILLMPVWIRALALTISCLSFLVCCHSPSQKAATKTIDLSFLKAEVPIDWETINIQGYDSDVKAIVTSSQDTIHLDYGPYSDPLENSLHVSPMKVKRFLDSLGVKGASNQVFSKTPELDQLQAVYLTEYYLIDTIDDRRAKIMLPKRIGYGMIAIYFPEVDSYKNRLTIYANNLDTTQQFAVYKMFKSIQFQ